MSKRKPLSKKQSNSNFKKGANSINPKNNSPAPMRGGIRL